MSTKALTDKQISKLEGKGACNWILGDTEVPRLKIHVETSGTKVFYLHYRHLGKPARYKIAKFGDIGVVEARKIALGLLADVARGNDPRCVRANNRAQAERDSVVKLGDFLEKMYWPWANVALKPGTVKRSRWFLESDKCFGGLLDVRMDELGIGMVQGIVQARVRNGNRNGNQNRNGMDGEGDGEGMTPGSINRARSVLMAVLNKAVEWQVIDKNPLGGWKPLRVDVKGVVRWLKEDEEQRLMAGCKLRGGNKDWFAVLVRMLLWTGIRPCEAFGMKWSDVDLERRMLKVDAAFSKVRKDRWIPMNERLWIMLQEWKECQSFALLGASSTDNMAASMADRLLFPRLGVRGWAEGRGKMRNSGQTWEMWKGFCKKNGLVGLRLYDLRHSFASKLVNNRVDLYTVSQLLGHSKVEMTKVYAHLSPEWMREAVEMC